MNNDKISVPIKCNVDNCKFNQNQCCCANEIKVGPNFATCCQDTVCQTFEKI